MDKVLIIDNKDIHIHTIIIELTELMFSIKNMPYGSEACHHIKFTTSGLVNVLLINKVANHLQVGWRNAHSPAILAFANNRIWN